MVRTPVTLAALLGIAGAAYGVAFWGMTTLDAKSAWSRFEALSGSGAEGRAVGHGDQALALFTEDGLDAESLDVMKLAVANAHFESGDPERAIELFWTVLGSPLGASMTEPERMELKHRVALLNLRTGQAVPAALIFSEFVDAAGDDAALVDPEDPDSQTAKYISYVNAAVGDFVDAMPAIGGADIIRGSESDRLYAADQLTNLGGYYARIDDGDYAAAGLLAAAYHTRRDILGPDHADTAHTALLLAPIYERIGRLTDAETIYLEAFHAQERVKGSNNPELSLYIRLLADVYQRQGRNTEAEALNVHMRSMFRDSFGARRYAPNRERNRKSDINRPVSVDFPLSARYAPDDLVFAAKEGIPVSKNPGLEEMMIRKAEEDDTGSMPQMLVALFNQCQSPQEKLSLRSGYRAYSTQKQIYETKDHKGQVAVPGTSEHQSGLAADIDVNGRFMRSTDRAYQCFEAHAWQHGFILTFPDGNEYLSGEDTYEPWHWRYVGKRTALLFRETGPLGYPQEFLAALPCYEERALAGLFVTVGEQDVCLATVQKQPKTAAVLSESADG
ncbi:D-alanyl-D-alanine carboxypeptidase family protein [Parvularcula sp. LCG005]|uniref:D-alanyl-D-alanine carboxypeptidase family protein n=1 Tax=Parvularcula sp. LCG005 TaxID=3078805 RepID=UPI002943DD99|nr:D-alanyl-D-alanine carboxypeptidase family protein [Parvularcula sp. LCG005]WOI52245.1 D-alanyl-D-alanine carboxypeptidase family protein [Parvularcula sp. LCG005]